MNPKQVKKNNLVVDLLACVASGWIGYNWLIAFVAHILFPDSGEKFADANKFVFFCKMGFMAVISVGFIALFVYLFRCIASRLGL